jgi:hypothetical protein
MHGETTALWFNTRGLGTRWGTLRSGWKEGEKKVEAEVNGPQWVIE